MPRKHKHQLHHHLPQDELERLVALRHLRGGPFFGGRSFGGGRGRARRGDVRIALLMLLAEEPRNGYALMQAIEERSQGRWRPSPGSVYPALAQLEDQGFIRATERDGAKVFEITPEGQADLDERGTATPPWEADDDDGSADAAGEVRSLIAQVAAAAIQVARVGDGQQVQRAAETLRETRRALYRILAEDPEA